jgi:hypothetical protein
VPFHLLTLLTEAEEEEAAKGSIERMLEEAEANGIEQLDASR